MPGVLVHFHLHQHVAGKELAVGFALLAVAHLDHLFRGHENLAELAFQARALDALFERFRHLVLEIRVGVNYIPSQRHRLSEFLKRAAARSTTGSARSKSCRAPKKTGPSQWRK